MSEISRAERIFRGMLGMGMTFAVIGGAVIAAMVGAELLFGSETLNKAGAGVISIAFLGGITISFGMGVLYAGLLALLARGRSFSQVSFAHVASAGAIVGLIPILILEIITLKTGNGPSLLTPLAIFPPVTALVSSATLLLARRAKPELASTDTLDQITP